MVEKLQRIHIVSIMLRFIRRCAPHAAPRSTTLALENAPRTLQVSFGGAIAAPFLDFQSGYQVRTKVSDRTMRRKNLRKMKGKVDNVPLLKDTLRKLYMCTHPDLFMKYPKEQQINDESYKELMGILDSIEKHNEFPPARSLKLPFYMKTPLEGQFQEVSLHMRTTGGACNTLVEEALGLFFKDCGLPSAFRWGEGSWGLRVGKDAAENANLGFEEGSAAESRKRQQAAAAAAEALENDEEQLEEAYEASTTTAAEPEYVASAYNPVDRSEPEDNSIERVLNQLNDVFEIIAAVPWMDKNEYGELRRHYEEENGLMDIEMRGYQIKAATELIWQGKRDLNELVVGLDADSAMIVQRILMHTLNIERKIELILQNGEVEEDEDDDVKAE